MSDVYGDTRGTFDIWLKYQSPGKYSVVTSIDHAAEISAFGEELSAQIMPQTAWRFDYGVNTRFISTSGTYAGGLVTGSASRAQLSTFTNVSGTAQIASIKPLRYLPGFGGLARFTAIFNSGTVNSEQLIGVMDGNISDGFAFGYNGANFGVVRIRAGVKTWTPQNEWNGSVLSESLIPQYGNIYQIRFQWLGYGNIYFMVFDKLQRKFVIVHTIEYPNTSALTSVLNPTLKLLARISNSGNNTNLTMFTPSALGALEGLSDSDYYNPLNVPNSFDSLVALSDTNNNHIVTIRNKATFAGGNNRVPVQVDSITVSRAGGVATAANSSIRLYRNATTAGALSFANVDTQNSPVESSATATTITGSNPERSYSLSQNNTQLLLIFKSGEFILNPGESLSVGAQNSGVQATDVSVTVNWSELF